MNFIGHNKNTFYLKILFIATACIILILDFFSIIDHGALCFLFVFSIFAILYGLTLLGLLDSIFSKTEEYINRIRNKNPKKKESDSKIYEKESNQIKEKKIETKKNKTEKKVEPIKKERSKKKHMNPKKETIVLKKQTKTEKVKKNKTAQKTLKTKTAMKIVKKKGDQKKVPKTKSN